MSVLTTDSATIFRPTVSHGAIHWFCRTQERGAFERCGISAVRRFINRRSGSGISAKSGSPEDRCHHPLHRVNSS